MCCQIHEEQTALPLPIAILLLIHIPLSLWAHSLANIQVCIHTRLAQNMHLCISILNSAETKVSSTHPSMRSAVGVQCHCCHSLVAVPEMMLQFRQVRLSWLTSTCGGCHSAPLGAAKDASYLPGGASKWNPPMVEKERFALY